MIFCVFELYDKTTCIHIKNRAWSPPSLLHSNMFFTSTSNNFTLISKSKMASKKYIYILCAWGMGGRRQGEGGIGGPPIKKWVKKKLCARGKGGSGGGVIGGAPYKKYGGKFFLLLLFLCKKL